MSNRTRHYRHLKFVFDLKNVTFSFFHIAISRNSLDLDKTNWRKLVSKQFLKKSVPNVKRIGEGECNPSDDLTWNDPIVSPFVT